MSEVPSTLFTAAPHWRWLIVFYFFLGGIAGGAYLIAALIDLFGRPWDRPLARLGYLVALPLTVICGILLVVDLNRPLRFWHMLLASETLTPIFKLWSPMSVGAWALLAFGFFTLLSFLAALAANDGWLRYPALTRLRPPGILGTIVVVLGGLLGFFIAGYTGVLLAVTNRPIWSDTSLIGLVFLISSASTGAAVLMLLARRRAVANAEGLHALERFDAWMLLFELVAIVALVVSLGSLARLWLNTWGVLLVLGVVGLGIVAPLLLYRRGRASGLASAAAAVLVLVGGFLLRVVIVLSSESI
jgi:formate-dependent nitrite reductase membrane component NrfD